MPNHSLRVIYCLEFSLTFGLGLCNVAPSCSLKPPTAHGRQVEEHDGLSVGVVQRGVHAKGGQRRHAPLSHSEGGGHPRKEQHGPERPLPSGVEPREGGHPYAQVSVSLAVFLESAPATRARACVRACVIG